MAALVDKAKDKVSQVLDNEKDRVNKVKEEVERLSKNRRRWEFKWREAEEFDSGRHFIVYDRASGRFTPMKTRPGMTFRVNHISWKKKRELQNTILMNDPRWKILPSPEAVDQAQDEAGLNQVMADANRIKQWFNELYTENKVQAKLATEVEKALVMPYSGMWVDIDEMDYSFKFEVCDAFDLLFDGSIDDVQLLPSITKIFRRDIHQLKTNPMYKNTDKIKADGKLAGSEEKNSRYKDKYEGGENGSGNTIICYETWQKVYLDDETRKKIIDFDIKNKRYKKEKIPQSPIPVMDEMGAPVYNDDGTPVMMEQEPVDSKHWTEELPDGYAVMYKTVTTKDCDYFHLEEYIDFPIYPVDIYAPETGAYFKPSWLERMMSPNKSLDMLQSRAEEYASMAGGRIIKHENTDISRVETDMGSAMEYSGTVEPRWETAPPLPPTVLERIESLKSEINDLSVMGGNVAQVAHNGRGQGAMESIKSSDMASVKTPVDLLARHLENLATIILTLADYYMDKPQTVRRIDGVENKPDYFKVIGGRYAQTEAFREAYAESQKPPIPVDPSTMVKVEIEPGIAMTPAGKLDLLFQALNMGVVDQQTILEQMKFENIGDILARTEKRQQFSMIDTPDFNALDEETQLSALEDAMSKNLTMPRDPQMAKMMNGMGGRGSMVGTTKKISTGGRQE